MDYWLANAIERLTINVLKHRLRVVVDMRDCSLSVSTLPPRPSTVALNPVHVRFHPSLREPTAFSSTAPATTSFASRSITNGASWSNSSGSITNRSNCSRTKDSSTMDPLPYFPSTDSLPRL